MKLSRSPSCSPRWWRAASCTDKQREPRADASSSVTQVAEPSDAIDQNLMVALSQAKNFHHKAKVYMSDGNLAAAIASVREILSLRFPPDAPEAEDVRNDARALLAQAARRPGPARRGDERRRGGPRASQRESFFVANLYTVKGEIHEARAAALDADARQGEGDRRAPRGDRGYDASIKINKKLQEQLMEER